MQTYNLLNSIIIGLYTSVIEIYSKTLIVDFVTPPFFEKYRLTYKRTTNRFYITFSAIKLIHCQNCDIFD